MKLYIVLKWIESKGRHEFEGIFDDVEKAVAICSDYRYGVFPCNLNEQVPDHPGWPGSWYPTNTTNNVQKNE